MRPIFDPVARRTADRVANRPCAATTMQPSRACEFCSRPPGSVRVIFDGTTARPFVAAVRLARQGAGQRIRPHRSARRPLSTGCACAIRASIGRRFDDLQLVRSDSASGPRLAAHPTTSGQVARASVLDTRARPGILVLGSVLPTLCVALLAVGLFSRLHVLAMSAGHDRAGHARRRRRRTSPITTYFRGLPNRAFFARSASTPSWRRMAAGQRGAGRPLLDLDRFKDINDTLRPRRRRPADPASSPNDCTACCADRTRSPASAATSSPSSRRACATANDCAALAHRILDAHPRALRTDGTQVYVGISIGIAIAPENGARPRRADAPRRRGALPGQARGPEPLLPSSRSAWTRPCACGKMVEEDLRDAIDRRRARASPTSRSSPPTAARSLGVEALVRWHHPVHGHDFARPTSSPSPRSAG